MSGHIDISEEGGSGDCDCCGWWSWRSLTVSKDGEPILEMSGDDHTGGGLHEMDDTPKVLQRVLEALGYTVTTHTYQHDSEQEEF